jgi:molybdopterin synthase sulfur carrier subunit
MLKAELKTAPVRILYLAWLRERAGVGGEEIDLPADVATVGALIAWLRARGGGPAAAFDVPKAVRAAVNQVFAGPDAAVRGGDEVAFFPPVTGG